MEYLGELAALAICFFILPILCGWAIARGKVRGIFSSFPVFYVAGWVLILAVFELSCVPMILLHQSLERALVLCATLLALAILVFLLLRPGELVPSGESADPWTLTGVLLALGILLVFGFLAVRYLLWMHVDEGDASFVANAVSAYETGTLFRYHPETGEALTSYPWEVAKEVVSPLSMLYAGVSSLAQIHPTILIHGVWPVVWLLLHLCCLFLLGKEWLGEREKAFFFVLACLLVELLGEGAAGTGSALAMTTLWQGNALVFALGMPLLLALLHRGAREEVGGWHLALFLLGLALCLFSDMGIILGSLGTAVLCLSLVLTRRSLRGLVRGLLCAFPGFAAMALYLLIARGFFK